MWPVLIFLLSLHHFQIVTRGEFLDDPKFSLNALSENPNEFNTLVPPGLDEVVNSNESPENVDPIPFVKSGRDQTEVEFRHPISSVNIDYSKNLIVLKFRKDIPKTPMSPEEAEKRISMEKNFMRFGRSPGDFMRFGKRSVEALPSINSIDHGYYLKQPGERYERSQEGIRDSRGDNFMRFGRASQDFMRFGRSPADFMRFGRNPGDFMRFGRSSPDFMRFGRSPSDFMRFGRGGPDDFMRFGRTPDQDFLRFGRTPDQDFMRFGRAQKMPPGHIDNNFVRFGRPDNFMRFGRSAPQSSDNFMRFGKMDQNFMRFGRNGQHQSDSRLNDTKSSQKNDIKEAAKVFHKVAKDTENEESNPMDKAIKELFNKHKQAEMEAQSFKSAQESDNSKPDDNEMNNDYASNAQ